MSEKITLNFLGTSSSTPTKDRNLTSLLINYKGVNYLFDSCENVQQQIIRSGQSLLKIKHIFITHFHGDHYYGLLGLLSSMSLNKREDDLDLYFPEGYKSLIENFIKYGNVNLTYKLNFIELKKNQVISFNDLSITTIKLDHSILSYGYVFKIKDKVGKFDKQKALKLKIPEGPLFSKLQAGKSIKVDGKTILPKQVMDYSFKKEGKKIIYFTDTAPLKTRLKIFESPDILIHECTFSDSEIDKAKSMKHTSATELSLFAKKISAKSLYVVHISARYKDTNDILKEVKKNYKSVIIPKDLDFVEILDY